MTSHTEKEEKVYSELVALYGYAEKLLDVVEENAEDVDADLDVVEPLVEQLAEAADILTEAYREFVETGKQPDEKQKEKIKAALERMYGAIDLCKSKVKQ